MAIFHFYTDLFQIGKIIIKDILSCVHHISIKLNDTLIAIKTQTPLMLGRFLQNLADVFCCRNIS